jgi:succinyl-diaminopimelate desuccinylase
MTMFDPRRLFDIVESRSDQLVAVLCDLLRFETVSGVTEPSGAEKFARETRRCLDYLRQFAERHNLTYREHPAGVAVIEWGEGDEAIGFPTHTDVVPPGGQWQYPPFDAVIEDDAIYGRGAQDNKGPLACGLMAVLAVRDLGLPTRRRIRLIFGTHEEGGEWNDVSAYLASEPAPLWCIVPDATFPIINGEKGMATLHLQPAGLAAPERTDGLRLDSVRSGERPNVVPDRAVVQLSGPVERKEMLVAELKDEIEAYQKSRPIMLGGEMAVGDASASNRFTATLTFLGRSAHGSRPHEGHNAAVDALGYLVRLGLPGCPALDFLGLAYCAGKDLSGAYLGIARRHPFIGPTTVSLNVFTLDSQAGQAQINVRHTLGQTSAQVLERVREVVAKKVPQTDRRPMVEYEGAVLEPLFTDPELYPELFAALRGAFQAVTGREAQTQATGGTTYAKGFPRAVTFGPVDENGGEPDMAHKADEFVTRAALLRNAKVYAYALAALVLT